MNLKNYEKLSSINAISGNEVQVRNYIKEKLKDADEIVQDKLGGIFGIYNGNGPRVMICAHMDEVGAIVKEIRKDGLIKFLPIGSIKPEVFVSAPLFVTTCEAKKIKGIISTIPPHISKDTNINFDDLTLDIGVKSKEECEKMGIEVGNMITFADDFYLTSDKKRIVNKALDDRVGCALVLDLVSEIRKINHPNTIILGGTVQEEVGLRGAGASCRLLKPDLFITVDISPASDYLGKEDEGSLGGGFLIRYFDKSNIMNPKLLKYFKKLAVKNKIKYQEFKSNGATDAAISQYTNSGILATTVGIPGRYIHSPHSMVDVDDIKSAHKFIIALIKDFTATRLEELKENKL